MHINKEKKDILKNLGEPFIRGFKNSDSEKLSSSAATESLSFIEYLLMIIKDEEISNESLERLNEKLKETDPILLTEKIKIYPDKSVIFEKLIGGALKLDYENLFLTIVNNNPIAFASKACKAAVSYSKPHILEKLLANEDIKSAITDANLEAYLIFSTPYVYTNLFKILWDNFKIRILTNTSLLNHLFDTSSPEIIALLIENDIEIPEEHLQRIHKIAQINHDKPSLTIINRQLKFPGFNLEKSWPYKKPSASVSAIAKDTFEKKIAYGTGISQIEYQTYFQQGVNRILLAMIEKKFSLAKNSATFFILSSSVYADSPDEKPGAEKEKLKYTFGWSDASTDFNHLVPIGEFRNYLAFLSASSSKSLFGELRKTGEVITPAQERYQSAFMKRLENIFDTYTTAKNSVIRRNDKETKPASDDYFFEFVCNLEDETLALTQYNFGILNQKNRAWFHADKRNLQKLIQHIDKLFNDILSTDTAEYRENPEKLIIADAELHWWLAHACPFVRGSAACSEMMIQALFNFHGYDLKFTETADLHALANPNVKDYIECAKKIYAVTKLESIAKDAELSDTPKPHV